MKLKINDQENYAITGYVPWIIDEVEEKIVQEIRRDEVQKSVFRKDEERLQSYLNN